MSRYVSSRTCRRPQSKDAAPTQTPFQTFIDFLRHPSLPFANSERSSKRQKVVHSGEDIETIFVKESKLVLPLQSSYMKGLDPIHCEDVPVRIETVREVDKLVRLDIYWDEGRNTTRKVLSLQSGVEDAWNQDAEIALDLAQESRSAKNPCSQGRLWTDIGIGLSYSEGHDKLEFLLKIRWNVTPTLEYVPAKVLKRPAMQRMLETYFAADAHETEKGDVWSTHDFYANTYVPSRDDVAAESIAVPTMDTELFPFQKRAVKWLLSREGVNYVDGSIQELRRADDQQILPYSFSRVTDAFGNRIYVSRLFGLVATDLTPFRQLEKLQGGVLAEEMGLGKTVEMIALISLHRRAMAQETEGFSEDSFTSDPVRASRATLIITPSSILKQWISELNRHAPELRVLHYKGIGHYRGCADMGELLQEMHSYDVVLTTYNVLASEVHYTVPPPDRSRRRECKYSRPRSPLMQFSWWRVCLDEAQMVESGVSNAAKVAKLIPRINSWAISGTPLKRDISDLLGLLNFLRLEPFASLPHIWSILVTSYRPLFKDLFRMIAIRQTKQMVRNELQLPGQRRYVITMPFTPVEEQYYRSLFQQMCEECGVDAVGAPLEDDWDPNDGRTVERMRSWLIRLRQSALHPEIGAGNRRALGHKDGPLRTVDQVLEAMLEQSEIAIRTNQRTFHLLKCKRGQLLENSPRVKEALQLWTEVETEAQVNVEESREQLAQLLILNKARNSVPGHDEKVSSSHADSNDDSESDLNSDSGGDADSELSRRIGTAKNRLRSCLEILHMAVFFRANAFFQIKTDEEMTKADSEEFQSLENLEIRGYERAKVLRQEILQEIFKKASRRMRKIAKQAAEQTFVEIPEFSSRTPKGGIESRRIMERLDELAEALDAQANQLDEWREKAIEFLLRPLVDEEDEGKEITGEEYEESTKTQDEVMVYVSALRAVIEDRHDALTGQDNILVKSDIKTALRSAKDGEGAFPEKTIELFAIRAQIKPLETMGSLRGFVAELRALATKLKLEADNGSVRSQNELVLVEAERLRVQKQLAAQTKTVIDLRQEIEIFTSLTNLRLEYYRQLQQVSDMVVPLEEPRAPTMYEDLLVEERKLQDKIASASSKRRYLLHLRDQAGDPDDKKMCIICQSTFELGALTVCGHQFCKDCITIWFQQHRNCPVCKKKLSHRDLHDITYKPREMQITVEVPSEAAKQERSMETKKATIYSEISKDTLAQIKNVELRGPSFGTKIDTLARHLIWLRESDPGAKSIIFSQFKDFLDVLGRAFSAYRIGYATIDKAHGTERFKSDAGIECFLLHGKAQSSGLNLVEASHVFLCEPLINTALELQAIARVDRIGQHQRTNVYLYLIQGSVEEAIYEISARRRMEHMGLATKSRSKESTPDFADSSIEAANSMELQQAQLANLVMKGKSGGEMVDKEDLWACLFGNTKREVSRSEVVGSEVGVAIRRHLAAEAAEERIEDDAGASPE